MKTKKIKWLLVLVLVFSIFTLYKVEITSAACCVGVTDTPNTNGYCFSTTNTNCPPGETYNASDCGSISSCTVAITPTTTGCCVGVTDTPNTNGYCFSTTNTNCPPGETYNASDCGSISSCTVSPGTGTTTPGTGTTTPGTGTTTPGSSTSQSTFPNPIGFSSVCDLLGSVLNTLTGLIAIISIIFIVLGGIMYMLSGGSEAGITRAKKTWMGAVIGLVISLAAPTFIKTIQLLLGGSSTGWCGSSAPSWVSSSPTLQTVATNVLNLLLSIFGVLAIIALIIGGGTYLTAYGDEKRIDSGKNIIKYAIIGIAVALAAIVIVRQIGNIMGAKFN